MSRIAFSAPEFIARDDAVGAHARASAKTGQDGQVAKDGKEGVSEFAALLKKAAETKTGGNASEQAQAGAGQKAGTSDLRSGLGRPVRQEEDGSELAGEGQSGSDGDAQAQGDDAAQTTRDMSLAQLLAAWSETSPRAAAGQAANGSAAAEQSAKAGAGARQGAGSVTSGQSDPSAQGWTGPAMPDDADALASTTPKMAAHIVDRQTHFAPVQTRAMLGAKSETGAAGTPGTAAEANVAARTEPNAAARGGAVEGPAERKQSGGPDPRVQGQRMAEHPGQQQPDEGRASSSSDKSSSDKGWRMASAGATGSEMPQAPGSNGQAGLPQSTLQRLGSSLVATAGDLVGARMSPAATADPQTSGDNMVRILELELTPAELGLVRVRMRMSNGGLELQVAAARQGTAQLLEQDSSKLMSIIKDAGYDVDSVTIQASNDGFRSHLMPHGRQEASSMPNPNPGGGSFQPQGETGAGGGNGRDRNPNSDNTSSQSSFKDDDGSNASKGETSRSGSLYV
ncbi:flagellar hook-length control protein FliK [Amorphus orientalis]|uniref:Flagellar hook-length control protein FliK n=1 Tax=Amorphus orientalis TaxID=649198 RepID=A0AAE4AUW7_9HYPH|nr:flagellar hook-length control protein FliK [Amorphus orientalis]MDQ0317607.1 flagellar hook-length control protein FliK [Amorphus orientalis]